jgi:hypothetical protein
MVYYKHNKVIVAVLSDLFCQVLLCRQPLYAVIL